MSDTRHAPRIRQILRGHNNDGICNDGSDTRLTPCIQEYGKSPTDNYLCLRGSSRPAASRFTCHGYVDRRCRGNLHDAGGDGTVGSTGAASAKTSEVAALSATNLASSATNSGQALSGAGRPGGALTPGQPTPVAPRSNTVLTTIVPSLSLIHISEPTRLGMISYAVF